jgi:enoyl-CoA hydratase/carnithine racemase
MKALYEQNDQEKVGLVTLNRPEKNNSMNQEMFDDFRRIVDEKLTGNKNINTIIVTGKGDSFCSGADLAEFLKLDNRDYMEKFLEGGRYFMNYLTKAPQFVIAAVNGPALGGGLEIALAADYVVAMDSDKPILGQLEMNFGLMPGSGATQRLPLRTGLAIAKKMIMSGERITPGQALAFKVVDELSNDPLQRALELSRQFKSKQLFSLGKAKEAIQTPYARDFGEETRFFFECLQRDETQNIIKAFFSRSGRLPGGEHRQSHDL